MYPPYPCSYLLLLSSHNTQLPPCVMGCWRPMDPGKGLHPQWQLWGGSSIRETEPLHRNQKHKSAFLSKEQIVGGRQLHKIILSDRSNFRDENLKVTVRRRGKNRSEGRTSHYPCLYPQVTSPRQRETWLENHWASYIGSLKFCLE